MFVIHLRLQEVMALPTGAQSQLISKADPLKYLMTRPTLSGRVAKWGVLLMEFEITFVPQKAVKGQALAERIQSQTTLLWQQTCQTKKSL